MNKFSQNPLRISEALAKSSPGFQKLLQSPLRDFRSSCKVLSATSEALVKSSPRLQKLLQSPPRAFKSFCKVLSSRLRTFIKSFRDFRNSWNAFSGPSEAFAKCFHDFWSSCKVLSGLPEALAKCFRDFRSSCKVLSATSEALAKSSPRLQKLLRSPLLLPRSSCTVLSGRSEAFAKCFRDFRSSCEVLSRLQKLPQSGSRLVLWGAFNAHRHASNGFHFWAPQEVPIFPGGWAHLEFAITF